VEFQAIALGKAQEGSEQPTRLEVWQGESPCTVNCLYSGG